MDYCGAEFKIIERAKADLLRKTNIDTSPSEMAVLDEILFRCWQMGWLDRYEKHGRWIDGADGSAFCSECGTEWLSEAARYYNFCPICGARMGAETDGTN